MGLWENGRKEMGYIAYRPSFPGVLLQRLEKNRVKAGGKSETRKEYVFFCCCLVFAFLRRGN